MSSIVAVKPGEPGFDFAFGVVLTVVILICGVLIWLLVVLRRREQARKQSHRGFEVKVNEVATPLLRTKSDVEAPARASASKAVPPDSGRDEIGRAT